MENLTPEWDKLRASLMRARKSRDRQIRFWMLIIAITPMTLFLTYACAVIQGK